MSTRETIWHEGTERVRALKESIPDMLQSAEEPVSAQTMTQAALLGFVTGLRSLTPSALLGWTSTDNPAPTNGLEEFLDSPVAQIITSALAGGELIGDKLPNAPSRIKPPVLLGRLVLGGLAGVSIMRRARQPLLLGAILGALGAGAGSYAGYTLRHLIHERTDIPDWIVGLIEDGAAFGLGWLAVKPEKE